jgi:hypothetical protein
MKKKMSEVRCAPFFEKARIQRTEKSGILADKDFHKFEEFTTIFKN